MCLLESPCRGDSNKYTKRMIYKRKKCSKVFITDALDGTYPIKFLYNSKFDFTAKSLVTNCRYNEAPLYNIRFLESVEHFGIKVIVSAKVLRYFILFIAGMVGTEFHMKPPGVGETKRFVEKVVVA